MIQIFFYCSLIIDDNFKTIYILLRLPLFYVNVWFYFSTIFTRPDLFPVCALSLFFWSFYKSLKVNFINMDSPYCFVVFRLGQTDRDCFNWLDIVDNMNNVSIFAFDKPVYNKLSPIVNQRQFTNAVRTIFPWGLFK